MSVPSSWTVRYGAPYCLPVPVPAGSAGTGVVVVNPPAGLIRCPAAKGLASASYVVLRSAPLTALGGQPTYINGIAVYPYPTGPATSYIAPSVGLEITISGPYGQRVLATLTVSPRDLVLASGTGPAAPSSWREVKFAGLGFQAPARWPVVETSQAPSLGAPCATPGVAFSTLAVTLSTDRSPTPLRPCSVGGASLEVPTDAIQLNSGSGSQAQAMARFTSKCVVLDDLTACPATFPAYSILVLKVTAPGGGHPVFVAIGLGDATTARAILHSFHSSH